MKNRLAILIGLLLVVILLSYMFFFQVRYDQVAVRTTFDKASPTSVKTQPGLYWRLPWPIQRVQHYTTLVQLYENRLEQIQTADSKSVAIRAYVTWRIENPLDFYVSLQNTHAAGDKLAPLLSGVISGTIGRYRMDQLVNTDRQRVKLGEIETEALADLRQQLANLGYGIQVEHVGIRRLLLPQESTAKVFDTMRKTRQRLASIARSSGRAQAETIKSRARAARDRIMAFAEKRAQALRAQGDQEAAQYYSAFRQDESLAVFLRRIETLKKVLPHNATFVLDADQLSLRQLTSPTQTPLSGAEPTITTTQDQPKKTTHSARPKPAAR